jgi:hypothetical protein
MNSAPPRLPKLALGLLAVALLMWAAGRLYTVRWNPEIGFYRAAAGITHQWAEELTAKHGRKVIIYGGSSCQFSIDGERLLNQHGIPCVNLGRNAGFGAGTMSVAALSETRPGDTLIVAIEPGLLTEPLTVPSLAAQFSVAMQHPEWVTAPALDAPRLNPISTALSLRPGGYHLITLVGKVARGQPLFRYQVADIRRSGWVQTDKRLPIDGPPGHGGKLSEDTRRLFASLRDWAKTNQVRVVYSLPWAYCPERETASFQRLNARFLREVMEFLPVLKDPQLGALADATQFSDTVWHLTESGSAARTDALGEQLKAWSLWTAAELDERQRP